MVEEGDIFVKVNCCFLENPYWVASTGNLLESHHEALICGFVFCYSEVRIDILLDMDSIKLIELQWADVEYSVAQPEISVNR